ICSRNRSSDVCSSDLMHKLDPGRSLEAFRHIHRGGNLGASPPAVLAAGFLALIAIRTLLLALPFASRSVPLGLFEAFFTATAAITVTGLAIVDPQQLSLFGQIGRASCRGRAWIAGVRGSAT